MQSLSKNYFTQNYLWLSFLSILKKKSVRLLYRFFFFVPLWPITSYKTKENPEKTTNAVMFICNEQKCLLFFRCKRAFFLKIK